VSVLKIKVGILALAEARDVQLPQQFAAWHQTVRVEPGTYDVFAYIEWSDGARQIRSLLAECEGVTISSDFRSHMLGQWGKSDNNRNGQIATAHIHLPTYGVVGEASPLIAQATLCDALVRTELDRPSGDGRMWRMTWNADRKPIVIEAARYGGGTSIAAFEDTRRFAVDGVEMYPADVKTLDLQFHHGANADQLTVGETLTGWSHREKRSIAVARLA
jgi:hypothetical protein